MARQWFSPEGSLAFLPLEGHFGQAAGSQIPPFHGSILEADFLQAEVRQSPVEEVGALGVAAMAFTHFGVTLPQAGGARVFRPGASAGAERALWAEGLRRARA